MTKGKTHLTTNFKKTACGQDIKGKVFSLKIQDIDCRKCLANKDFKLLNLKDLLEKAELDCKKAKEKNSAMVSEFWRPYIISLIHQIEELEGK